MKKIPANTPILFRADHIGGVHAPMDGTDLRRKKIIHRIIERIDQRIDILIKIRNRLAELEYKINLTKSNPTLDPQDERSWPSVEEKPK